MAFGEVFNRIFQIALRNLHFSSHKIGYMVKYVNQHIMFLYIPQIWYGREFDYLNHLHF